MEIAVAVGQFHRGNTSEYVQRALVKLGHTARIIEREEFYEALKGDRFALYFCVDSGETIDFAEQRIAGLSLERVCFWFIDYRHHKDGATRVPGDRANALELARRGGWVFQAQDEDVADCEACGIARVSWLPLAADPEVWSDTPSSAATFDLGFIGNVWDVGRAKALELLLNDPLLRLAFPGHGKAWKEDGAALLRRCRAGFNISSYFGSEHAFDINMRVFETLSCARPLITNWVPRLSRVFGDQPPFIRTFRSHEELLPTVRSALADGEFLNSGAAARRFILERATYEQRMVQVLEALALPQ